MQAAEEIKAAPSFLLDTDEKRVLILFLRALQPPVKDGTPFRSAPKMTSETALCCLLVCLLTIETLASALKNIDYGA
ncbi:hypothetical protein TNCV_2514291 [Trichonephila clavipes]|nr:hypothetical protein TNCV_2514291 [Trichonephila clavipes]